MQCIEIKPQRSAPRVLVVVLYEVVPAPRGLVIRRHFLTA
jgi:hypothetical protein